jgi:hypothetical protein
MAATHRDSRVFVNCPFDFPFVALFHAIIFAIHDLGFQARHALIDDAEAIRLRRISNELAGCRYSIHDLSRVEIGGSQKVPRFNMPFEAGLAYAAHTFGTTHRPHHLLLLDSAPYRYQASLSDAAGLDPKIHHGRAPDAIEAVRNFLSSKSQTAGLPGATFVAQRYALFNAKLPNFARARHLRMKEVRSLNYVNDLQAIMVQWIADNPP